MKRRWFQIHLSTAVVLMFVTSGLLFLNLSERHRVFVGENWTLEQEVFGWPFRLLKRDAIGLWFRTADDLSDAIQKLRRGDEVYTNIVYYFWPFVVADLICCCTTIGFSGVLMEYLNRRREVRQP